VSFNRRQFLRSGLGLGAGAVLAGWLPRRSLAAVGLPSDGLSATFDFVAGGTPLGLCPFLEEDTGSLEKLQGDGLDGRLFHDLSWLSPNALVTPNSKFFIRTRTPDQLDRSQAWAIELAGLVEKTQTLTLEDLARMPQASTGPVVMECSGNGRQMGFGMLSCASFEGVPLTAIFARMRPTGSGARVLVTGFDEHSKLSANNHSTKGSSWVFSPKDLEHAVLATSMNGEPLTSDHGAPVRLMIPGWYGCTCIKWVNSIRFVEDDILATPQMQEFAGRTHQQGIPHLARDYAPSSIDQAAMPIRVERWRLNKDLVHRIVGVTWGGGKLAATQLGIRCSQNMPSEDPFFPVPDCAPRSGTFGWSLWSALWQPKATGNYALQLVVNDPTVVTRRLATGYYTRVVRIDEV
jgi:DMSO/TMAO reductase YedYZ molybdopterin-dependent catalytic subunit